MRRIAVLVTIDDLKKNFTGEAGWRVSIQDKEDVDGNISKALIGRSNISEIEIIQQGPIFNIKIEAIDDPSDSDEIITDEPMKALTEFLETGTAGDEYLKKMSSIRPEILSQIFHRLGTSVEQGRMGPRKLSGILRRLAISTYIEPFKLVFAALSRIANGPKEDVEQLQKEMKKKGWDVFESGVEHGYPTLEVDVSGIYKAEISIDSINYSYKFSLLNDPSIADDGTTDDPIAAFDSFHDRPEVREAKEVLKYSKKEFDAKAMEEGTVPPKRGKPPVEKTEEMSEDELLDKIQKDIRESN